MQIYAYTHHANAHTHTHIYTHAHTHAHTRTLTNTHTRTKTRTYLCTKCMCVNFHTLLYSFWTLFEKSPTTRNLSMCANMLSDALPIQRLTTINHLFMRVGMEEYVFPQNVMEFDCRTTLGLYVCVCVCVCACVCTCCIFVSLFLPPPPPTFRISGARARSPSCSVFVSVC